MQLWDLPLRLFHWGLAVAVVGAVASSKADIMWLHERFGLTVMGLIGFRIVWGFIGGHYARFQHFITTPKLAFAGLLRLFKANDSGSVGHSAIAGYAVIGLLGVTAFLAVTGTISNDDVLFDGPLAHLLPSWSDPASTLHEIGEKFLFLMVALHIAAILIYKFIKKRNLTMSMIHGRATTEVDSLSAIDGGISRRHAVFGILLLISFVLASNALSWLRPSLY